MKDSGVEWIGEIPEHWEKHRLRFLCKISTGDKDTKDRIPDGKYPFFVRSPDVERINSYSYDGEAILMAGDGVGAGKVFHYFNGKFDYHQRVYNLHQIKKINPRLLFFYLQSVFSKRIEEDNAKSTVDSIRLPMLLDFPVVFTPQDEQNVILSFLDRKCAQIDAILANIQQSIAKLKEYRQAIITKAVTRGLDPNAKMKDSGVEWIGEIPEEWEVRNFKKYALICNGKDATSVEDEEGTYPIMGSGGEIGKSASFIYNKPSVLLGRKGTIDKPIFITEPFWTIDTMFYTAIKNNSVPRYFYYLCLSIPFDIFKSGSTIPSMTAKDLYNINFPYPPLSVQQKISAYLDQKTTQIDAVIAQKQKLHDKFTAYKKSLIYEYVTGKKEVPDE